MKRKRILGDVGDIESKWTMFKTLIMEVAVKSCGQEHWWTPEVKEALKLKKEAFQAWLAGVSAKAGVRYCFCQEGYSQGCH